MHGHSKSSPIQQLQIQLLYAHGITITILFDDTDGAEQHDDPRTSTEDRGSSSTSIMSTHNART